MSELILMTRRDLSGLPEPLLPDGYTVRTYQEGDEASWARIITAAFPEFHWDEAKFKAEFASQPQFRPEILFLAVHQATSEAVGTAMAWTEKPSERLAGCVHWVAVDPAHQGRGVGRLLTLRVLHRMKLDGLVRAYLHTEPYRTGAIAMYESLGFRQDS